LQENLNLDVLNLSFPSFFFSLTSLLYSQIWLQLRSICGDSSISYMFDVRTWLLICDFQLCFLHLSSSYLLEDVTSYVNSNCDSVLQDTIMRCRQYFATIQIVFLPSLSCHSKSDNLHCQYKCFQRVKHLTFFCIYLWDPLTLASSSYPLDRFLFVNLIVKGVASSFLFILSLAGFFFFFFLLSFHVVVMCCEVVLFFIFFLNKLPIIIASE
jgi:hypothetical protein